MSLQELSPRIDLAVLNLERLTRSALRIAELGAEAFSYENLFSDFMPRQHQTGVGIMAAMLGPFKGLWFVPRTLQC